MTDRLLRWCALLCLPLILISCRHDELCYLHPHTARVRIDVDWQYFKKYEIPTGMTVMLFPDDGAEPFRTITGTIDHAVMSLPVGMYHVLVFNQSESEFGSFSFRDMNSPESAVVAVERTSRWYSRGEEERVAAAPEWLGVGNFRGAGVTQEMIANQSHLNHDINSRASEPVIAKVTPYNILQTVIVRVHLEQAYNLRSARAALTGISEGHMLTKGKRLNSKVTHLLESFTLVNDEDDPAKGYIEARFLCFGLPDNHGATPEENELALEMLLVDNKTTSNYNIPVGHLFVEIESRATESADGASDYKVNNDLLVEVYVDANGDPIILPNVDPVDNGSAAGFDATVEDWEEVEQQDIPM